MEARETPLLCYATNVHPAEDVPGLLAMLEGPATAVRERVSPGGTLDLGLWLSRNAARTIASSSFHAAEVRARLRDRGLRIATANAFPAGGFHAAVVKERVYHPPWGDPARLAYTEDAGHALLRLLDPGTTCVVSTVPGTWKRWADTPAERRTLAAELGAAAETMASLHEASGVRLVLAPEPEPGCTLDTTDETIAFWRQDLLPTLGRDAERLLPHLGICIDLAHVAVAGEDPATALARLRAAGVPVAKVQVSAALEVARPASDPAAVEALRKFDEPRWLHQVGARDRFGAYRFAADLPEMFAHLPAWLEHPAWRVHFHAPLHEAAVAGVRTTRDLAASALRGLVASGAALPVLEVETYTWSALPGGPRDAAALADGIARELAFARAALSSPAAAEGVSRSPGPAAR